MGKTENSFFGEAQEQAYLNALLEQAKMLEAEKEERRNEYPQYLGYLEERGVVEHE